MLFYHVVGVVAEFCFSQAWYSEVLLTIDEGEGSESVLTEPLVDELVETYDFGVGFFEVDDCHVFIEWLGKGESFEFAVDIDGSAGYR